MRLLYGVEPSSGRLWENRHFREKEEDAAEVKSVKITLD